MGPFSMGEARILDVGTRWVVEAFWKLLFE